MRNVLIVESDLAAGMAYFRAFAVAGFHADHVTTGAKALAALDRSKPDVVVLSLLLRENQAVDLLQAIRSRSRTRTLPVLAFARGNVGDLIGKARSEGANECVMLGQSGVEDLVNAGKRMMPSPTKSQAAPRQGADSAVPAPSPRAAPPAPERPPKPTPPARELAQPSAKPEAASKKDVPSKRTDRVETLKGLSRSLLGAQDPTALRPLLIEFQQAMQTLAAEEPVGQSSFGASLFEALLALLKDLCENPQRVSSSNVRTIYQAVNSLDALLNHPSLSSGEAGPQFKILAVDDEPSSRTLVQRALTSSQLATDSAQDPLEALELSRQRRYDLFVLDINMPNLSGFELCAKLRASPPYRKTPVIFVTGSDNFESRLRSASSGGDDFIGKPFLTRELTLKAWIHLLPRHLGL